MKKHAYLIIAHHQFEQLRLLLSLLDDARHDFYIHIDQRAKDFSPSLLEGATTHSKVTLIPSLRVAWGGFSMVRCEIMLLKAAIKGEYAYYHLLSGADLPLKASDEILAFFDARQGAEFIHFCKEDFNQKRWVRERISLYHPLQEWVGKGRGLLFWVEKGLERAQRWLGVDRLKKSGFALRTGAQWFSITHSLAAYVLEREDWIKAHFRSTLIGDEAFLQTLVANGEQPFSLYLEGAEGDYRTAARLIDFHRGTPYTFKMADLKELLSSDRLFARKFDYGGERELCLALYEEILRRKEKKDECEG